MFDWSDEFEDEDARGDDLEAWRELEVVARFGTLIEAQLMRGTLAAHGIRALVRDEHTAGIDPALIVPMGYVRLATAPADAARARAVIAELPTEAPDDELDDGVRCPECGSVYVVERAAACRCRRCDAHFERRAGLFGPAPQRDDDGAGSGPHSYRKPARHGVTPVFRLRRNHRGLGLFVGAVCAFFAVIVLRSERASAGWFVAVTFAGPGLGWLVGRSQRVELCSEPSCRAPLGPDAETCSGCLRAVAWPITRASEHYRARSRWLRGERSLD